MGVEIIQCYGDTKIILKLVRNQIHCLSPRLLNYQKLVRDMTNSFKSFNIKYVPRSQNFDADLLENTASRLIPLEGMSPTTFSTELMYRPSIPDNVTSWKIFDDDVQILDFLTSQDTFKYFAIDEVEHEKSLSNNNFPSNLILKLFLNLEKFYDLQHKFKGNPNCKTHSSTLNYKIVNIGNGKNPQLINIGITCSPEKERALVKL